MIFKILPWKKKASVLWHSAFFMVQLSHLYMTTRETVPLTRWTFVSKVMSLLFNTLFRFVITFLDLEFISFIVLIQLLNLLWGLPCLIFLIINGCLVALIEQWHTYLILMYFTLLHLADILVFTNQQLVAALHWASLSEPFLQQYLLILSLCHIWGVLEIFQTFLLLPCYDDLWSSYWWYY